MLQVFPICRLDTKHYGKQCIAPGYTEVEKDRQICFSQITQSMGEELMKP